MSSNPIAQEETSTTRSQEEIEFWLVSKFAEWSDMEFDDVDIDRPFADFQLDSSVAVTITADLAKWIGRELPETLFWEHPTIRGLSEALASGE